MFIDLTRAEVERAALLTPGRGKATGQSAPPVDDEAASATPTRSEPGPSGPCRPCP